MIMKLVFIVFICVPIALNAQVANCDVSGSIKNRKTKAPLPFTVVRILNTNCGVMADDKGYYNLKIPDTLIGKKYVIEYDFVGFRKLRREIKFQGHLLMDVVLEEQTVCGKKVIPSIN